MQLYQLKAERVRSLIETRELKKWWVAEITGVHKTTLRRWLSGRIDRVREDHVLRLAEVLATTGGDIAIPIVV